MRLVLLDDAGRVGHFLAAAAFVAVGVGMVALAIATAPMARADSTDDAFIAAVHQAGFRAAVEFRIPCPMSSTNFFKDSAFTL